MLELNEFVAAISQFSHLTRLGLILAAGSVYDQVIQEQSSQNLVKRILHAYIQPSSLQLAHYRALRELHWTLFLEKQLSKISCSFLQCSLLEHTRRSVAGPLHFKEASLFPRDEAPGSSFSDIVPSVRYYCK